MGQEIIAQFIAVLLLGIFIGKILSFYKIPKVTGYILTGVLISFLRSFTYFGDLLHFTQTHEFASLLSGITEISFGVILWHVGGHFHVETMRKSRKAVVLISLCETSCTFFVVFLLSAATFVIVASFYPETWSFGNPLLLAALLGVLGVSTAPASTAAVLREYDSQGPLSEYIFLVLGLNSIICVTLAQFAVGNHGVVDFVGPGVSVVLSVFFGVLSGFVLSFLEQFFEKASELAVLVLGIIVVHSALAELSSDALIQWGLLFSISPTLVHLFCGISFVNLSTKRMQSFQAVKNIDAPLYVFLFVAAGMKLHFEKFLDVQILLWVYVVGRILGKVSGAALGLRSVGLFQMFRHYLGFSLLSQGALVIGLVGVLSEGFPAAGDALLTIVLAAVVVFEIVGPVAVQKALVYAGEITPISFSSIKQYKIARNTYMSLSFRLQQFLKRKHIESRITCQNLLRTGIETLFDSASFYDVLAFFSMQNYGKCIVVDRAYHFIGVISYKEIRDIMLHEDLHEKLPTAGAIAETIRTVHPDDDIHALFHAFHASERHLDYMPVVTDHQPPHFIGIVTQKDVMAYYKQD